MNKTSEAFKRYISSFNLPKPTKPKDKPPVCTNKECWLDWEGADLEGIVHCEMPDCHNTYFEEKNGYLCEICSAKCCENCSDDGRFTPDDFFICHKCSLEKLKDCSYISCQNPACRKINRTSTVVKCKDCRKIFCEECNGYGKEEYDRGDNIIFTCEECSSTRKKEKKLRNDKNRKKRYLNKQ
jgi:hypothetical protein